MQVITEELGLNLDKVELDMLGSCKKVCINFFHLKSLLTVFSMISIYRFKSVETVVRPAYESCGLSFECSYDV